MREVLTGGLFLLSERQMARLSPHVSLAHGVQRVDDRRVVSDRLYHSQRPAMEGRAEGHGPHKTLIIASSAGAGSVGSVASYLNQSVLSLALGIAAHSAY